MSLVLLGVGGLGQVSVQRLGGLTHIHICTSFTAGQHEAHCSVLRSFVLRLDLSLSECVARFKPNRDVMLFIVLAIYSSIIVL